MKYQHVLASCGGIYSGMNGTISSPNYPLNYQRYEFCVYMITVTHGSACIEFTDFYTYPDDKVNIYEGVTRAKRIGR